MKSRKNSKRTSTKDFEWNLGHRFCPSKAFTFLNLNISWKNYEKYILFCSEYVLSVLFVIGAIITQLKNGLSDEEDFTEIQINPYLRNTEFG